MKYIELLSTDNSWLGSIFVPIIKETKTQYITKEYPSLGLVSTNIRDSSNSIVRWSKERYRYLNSTIKKIWEDAPSASYKLLD